MIKAVATGADGRTMILLGLSKMNVQKLKEQKPIMLQLEEFGIRASLLILYGETDAAIVEEIKKTGVTIESFEDRRLKG